MNFIERINEKEQRLHEQEEMIVHFMAWIGVWSLLFWVCYLFFLWGYVA